MLRESMTTDYLDELWLNVSKALDTATTLSPANPVSTSTSPTVQLMAENIEDLRTIGHRTVPRPGRKGARRQNAQTKTKGEITSLPPLTQAKYRDKYLCSDVESTQQSAR